jgi:hypothetical protein
MPNGDLAQRPQSTLEKGVCETAEGSFPKAALCALCVLCARLSFAEGWNERWRGGLDVLASLEKQRTRSTLIEVTSK